MTALILALCIRLLRIRHSGSMPSGWPIDRKSTSLSMAIVLLPRLEGERKIKSYKLFKTTGQAQQIEFTFRSFFHFCTKKGCQRYKTISPLPGKKVSRPRVHCLPTYVSLFTSQTRAISGFLAIWWSIGVLASFAWAWVRSPVLSGI